MAKARKKVGRCPECDGPQRGPKAHLPSCSRFKGGGTGKARKASGGYDTSSLARLDAPTLIKLRDDIVEVLRNKRPELEAAKARIDDVLEIIDNA